VLFFSAGSVDTENTRLKPFIVNRLRVHETAVDALWTAWTLLGGDVDQVEPLQQLRVDASG